MDGTSYNVYGNYKNPAIVLIHGLGLSQDMWAPYLPYFQKKYFVITYDLYGHGRSDRATQTVTLTLYARQVAMLLEKLNINEAALIGFSIGGMITRRFALDYSNSLTAQVILNSPHDRGEEGQNAVEERAKTVRYQGAMATMETALVRWFTKQFLEKEKKTIRNVIKWRELVDFESYAQAAWVLASGVRELIKPYPPINVETLVITCENDTGSTPEMAHHIASEIINSTVHIIPDLQHLGVLEKPEHFSSIILEFLERINK